MGFANLKGKGLKFMCKEIDKFADELSSEERTKAAAMLLKMGCKAKDTVKMLCIPMASLKHLRRII